MILKYVLLVIIAIFFSASDPYFGYELIWPPAPKEKPGDVRELSWRSTNSFQRYLEDRDDRVDDTFKISPFYFPNVQFWFLIYTQFGSDQVVLHDKENMTIIYKVLDFSALRKKDLNSNVIYLLQQKLADEKLKELQHDLEHLIQEPFSLQARAKSLYRTIQQSGVKIPISKDQRIDFFKDLRANLRSQTGQKDHIRNGLIRAKPYREFLLSYFQERKLPSELIAIPFLESSFNPRAHSKANALGVWQFMPFIASHFFPKRTPHMDYRSNIGVASVSAASLMAQNYRIMKSWDLAVTAYNSGTRHLRNTKRELGDFNINLETVIKHSDSKHFGFASKNFYSEFLALAHTLAYRDELFPELKHDARPDSKLPLNFYLSKCTQNLSKVLNETQLEDLIFHNHHIRDVKKNIDRGTIVTTKGELPSKRFLLIPRQRILKDLPKDWVKLLKNQSCSTR